MVICKIYGGIGNQLFQYCLGRQLAITNSCKLKLDLSYFDTDNAWPYALDFYNVNYDGIATNEETKELANKSSFWNPLLPSYKRIIAKDKNKAFQPNILRHTAPCIIDGYWQSERYFKGIENIIREDLLVKPNNLSEEYKRIVEKLKGHTYISLHVRRGDYVKVGAPLSSIEYYSNAIDKIKEMIEKPKILVFSDDIAWVKENIKIDLPVEWMENELVLEDYEALQIMSKCSHHIIANSTYSWWGAWLNQHTEKLVIYPKIASTHLNKDLMPADWIGI